jgi:predicted  nucleic acid-binding Zn ribbon protein
MEKYAILLGYFDKQIAVIQKLYAEIASVDIAIYDKQFLFALRTQQFYTAIEDLFKQIAKSFENHVENLNSFHKELLVRMATEVPNIRPSVLSKQSLILLDKVRAFRHFIRHAYDCELNREELQLIQDKLNHDYFHVEKDLQQFRIYINQLAVRD